MPKYIITISQDLEIEAENIIQAYKISKKCKVIPTDCFGSTNTNKNHIPYSIKPANSIKRKLKEIVK